MASQRGTEFKVGLFVFVSLLVGGASIFIIGSANQNFDKQVALYTSFQRVSGLQMGSQVRLSGLKIGVVDKVWVVKKSLSLEMLQEKAKQTPSKKSGKQTEKLQLGCQAPELPLKKQQSLRNKLKHLQATKAAKELKISFICVRMKVKSSSLQHVRTIDSVAMVQGKGLLGDSLIEISMGTEGQKLVADGFVKGKTPKGLSDFMAEGGEVISTLKRSLARVEEILVQFSDPTLAENLKQTVASVEGIIGRMRKGPGLLHDLFYDRRLTNNTKKVVAQFQTLATSVNGSISQLNRMIRLAKRKGTLVDRLLLSRRSGRFAMELERLLRAARGAIVSLRQVVSAPQKPGTLLHKVLYEKQASRLITDLTSVTKDLRGIMTKIRKGKGTLGAIINDPTAFEDFKAILGQVKRSRVFKALIRFVIKRDESTKGGRVVRP